PTWQEGLAHDGALPHHPEVEHPWEQVRESGIAPVPQCGDGTHVPGEVPVRGLRRGDLDHELPGSPRDGRDEGVRVALESARLRRARHAAGSECRMYPPTFVPAG